MAADLNLCSTNGNRVGSARASGTEEKESLVRVECPVMESVGWLVSQDEDTVKIATTIDRHDSLGENDGATTFYGIIAFPAGCVLSCVPLHTLIN